MRIYSFYRAFIFNYGYFIRLLLIYLKLFRALLIIVPVM